MWDVTKSHTSWHISQKQPCGLILLQMYCLKLCIIKEQMLCNYRLDQVPMLKGTSHAHLTLSVESDG